jgi:hypothetical protein
VSANTKAPWIICPQCKGDGTIEGLGQVTRAQFSDDEWGDYLDGGCDIGCRMCAGQGKVREGQPECIVRFGSHGQKVQYDDADDASEHLLRMAEGWA